MPRWTVIESVLVIIACALAALLAATAVWLVVGFSQPPPDQKLKMLWTGHVPAVHERFHEWLWIGTPGCDETWTTATTAGRF
jgi:hypothetical protein